MANWASYGNCDDIAPELLGLLEASYLMVIFAIGPTYPRPRTPTESLLTPTYEQVAEVDVE